MGVAVVDPYRISFRIPGVGSDIEKWLRETSPLALEAILRMTIPNGGPSGPDLCKLLGDSAY